MRLKEIKPGMVIHCKTKEELEHAIEYLKIDVDANYIWNYKSSFDGDSERRDCFSFDEAGNYNGFCSREYFESEGYTITEFSDLILPELTAEEAIKLHAEVCKHSCMECPLYEVEGYENCDDFCFKNPEKAVEILAQWKANHEKKEPEIEWVYRVFGAENYGEKFFQTEEEAIKRCEELAKSQKTKQYARYERVCRVKAVE